MKIFLVIISLFISFFGLMSCASKKQVFDPQADKKDYIYFGNGGGFTGAVTKYYLTSDGNIYMEAAIEYKKIASVPADNAKQFFINYTSLGMDKTILNEPGNRYFFIGRESQDQSNMLKWGKNPVVSPNIETMYNILMNMVKKNTPSNNQ
jgi:hypothetical protein